MSQSTSYDNQERLTQMGYYMNASPFYGMYPGMPTPPLPSSTTPTAQLIPPPPPPTPPPKTQDDQSKVELLPSASLSAETSTRTDEQQQPTTATLSVTANNSQATSNPASAYDTEYYQKWLQWSCYYQQAQAYQNQLYQFAAQQTPPTMFNGNAATAQPQQRFQQPSSTNANGPNNNLNVNNNNSVRANISNLGKLQQNTFKGKNQSYRQRFNNWNKNNNNTAAPNPSLPSYNNVPPPSNLAVPQQQPTRFNTNQQQPMVRFQIGGSQNGNMNVSSRQNSPQIGSLTNHTRPARKTRFSSPPKGFETTPDDDKMDTVDIQQKPMSAIQAFTLACDRKNWPETLRKYWQSIESVCYTPLLRSQAEEWLQGILVEAFQKNTVQTIDWTKKPFPEFLLTACQNRCNNQNSWAPSSADRKNVSIDSTTADLIQIARSSNTSSSSPSLDGKVKEDLSRLNKLRRSQNNTLSSLLSECEQNVSNSSKNGEKRPSTSSSDDSTDSYSSRNRKRSSSPSNTSFNSSNRKRTKNMNRYSQQQQRRAKQQIKKMQATMDGGESKEELSERLEKRRNRFNNDEQQQSENTTEQVSLMKTEKEFKPVSSAVFRLAFAL
ncbi:unnamed protein product [Didymodactylos carnosus]|uniref:Uncharacterized protein n=1 Tax=Didymodactylos carnosus TaxID=1234261 RepID=A0A815AIM1_9BILA|nr:unnamed protein product [Didymodactylos carnosus]CAF1292736.1 unnamed protein product [Didymodactylos carnosus]CAF4033275.1 unnamed protein product [Didymodactylos carnosus]CAF4097528.1 unnamed protein product [Didymodactylos carnosus]